jgi:hypothetical protein
MWSNYIEMLVHMCCTYWKMLVLTYIEMHLHTL